MERKLLNAAHLRLKSEHYSKNTSATNYNLYEMNILKLQKKLEVFQVQLQLQFDEVVNLTGVRDKLAAELAVSNRKLTLQLKEKDKQTAELLKKTEELLQLSSHVTNREIKIMMLENEIKELLKNTSKPKKNISANKII